MRFGGVSVAGLVVGGTLAAIGMSASAPTVHAAVDPLAEAWTAGDCARCHEVPHIPALARVESCHSCHVWIRGVASDPVKREKAMAVFPLWERYEKNVATYLEVPRLDAAMARLRPEWVRSYLADPHDLRPNLPETMPRMALTPRQIDAIVGAFRMAQSAVVEVTPVPRQANVEAGRRIFEHRGCAGCHTLGGAQTGGTAPLAPDLAFARYRLDPDLAAAWIFDPKSVSAGATMPASGLSRDETIAVRDYIYLTDSVARIPAEPPPAPVAVKREVRWAEVEERVFGRICQHCHMNGELNQGRLGPGNGGGFGYPATGIELQTLDGVRKVAHRIPDALMRRRAEACRDFVQVGEQPSALPPGLVPGMPLGLPPIPDADIALVLSWIEQGMPE